ncbi:hypothetical protein [Nitrososphaera sp.]|uniref:hypothetical protein n=1 Tax=Nitrososphaera sp. TaxID=1971748 RepID=UPI00307DAF55
MSLEFCRQVLSLDPGIRFAGVANPGGKLLAAEYREGLSPLLDRNEVELAVARTVLHAMEDDEALQGKLGKTAYSITTCEKVKRATVPFHDKHRRILLVSFDTSARPGPIIRKKILPLINSELGWK